MFLRPKTYLGGFHMTQVHFTLKTEDIQSLIEESVENNASKLVLQTLFNQIMEQQRTEYVKLKTMKEAQNALPREMDILKEVIQLE